MEEKIVQLNITIPEKYRSVLRKIAAERMLEDTQVISSAAQIAREIICSHLDEVALDYE